MPTTTHALKAWPLHSITGSGTRIRDGVQEPTLSYSFRIDTEIQLLDPTASDNFRIRNNLRFLTAPLSSTTLDFKLAASTPNIYKISNQNWRVMLRFLEAISGYGSETVSQPRFLEPTTSYGFWNRNIRITEAILCRNEPEPTKICLIQQHYRKSTSN